MKMEQTKYEIMREAWAKNITRKEVKELALKLFGNSSLNLTTAQKELLVKKIDNLSCQKGVSEIEQRYPAFERNN